ncbi:DNA sulfur modification protein DndB [Lentibacillus saliphilus]|uniref:DNA sulfur modification protein DndB n=1 Tax=Lentibacillus saliphilus TaxID=2737028 RepID=UPI001C305ADF|nr:DNA sulfur modification protein DndB [Lentibacillus saliphilus]
MESVRLKGDIELIDDFGEKGLMSTQIKVSDILKLHQIDSQVNRDISYPRLPKIEKYIESFDSEHGIYFPSIVATFREEPGYFYDKERRVLSLPSDTRLVIIDGQHRLKALENFLKKTKSDEEKRQRVLNSQLTLQLYFGLAEKDEKSLFADINSNSKRVSMSLVTSYDTREIMNVIITDIHKVSKSLQSVKIEFEKSRIMRPKDTSFLTSSRLKQFINYLLFGKKNTNNNDQLKIKEQYDEVLSFLERFFYVFIDVLPMEPGNVIKYVLGHEPMQNAIALYLNERIIDNNSNYIAWTVDWAEKVEDLKNVDWSLSNSKWKPYMYIARAKTPSRYYAFIENTQNNLLTLIEEEVLK